MIQLASLPFEADEVNSNPVPKPSLSNDEVHVWYGGPECIANFGTAPRWRSILSDEEAARGARFLFPEDGQIRLAARVLLRTVLSRYAEVPPEAWQFTSSALGKPSLTGPSQIPPLKFNLSHTRGLIALAVGLDLDLGIDAESLDRHIGKPLIRTALADSEWNQLNRLPVQQQTRRFCEFWTLKEAYLKARGIGLQQPLKDFAFLLDEHRPPRILFSQRLDDVSERWQFWQDHRFPQHTVALAIARPDRTSLAVHTFHATI